MEHTVKIKTVTKLDNGDMLVEPHEGASFTIKAEDELFQVFTIWAMLNPGGNTGRLRPND